MIGLTMIKKKHDRNYLNMKHDQNCLNDGIKKKHSIFSGILSAVLLGISMISACSLSWPSHVDASTNDSAEDDTIILRVSNWEEYIDEGDWDEDETISLPDGDIIGENHVVDDFEEWYYETYGQKVKVEYSTFGTNEDFYNMYNLGNVYDLVCPSEYMMMKLMAKGDLQPYSDSFYDTSDPNNYYINGVSPYIENVFKNSTFEGNAWADYFAGYMWGITGIVYNPEVVSAEDVTTWKVLDNPKYYRQVTIKDNVRDSYFAAVAAVKSDLLTSQEFLGDPDYKENLENEMNDTSKETVKKVQDFLQDVRDNTYSFESDAGKADMITGKVVANYQWSGDGTYTLDQAEEDGLILNFAVPEEASNIYFDGWVMLKSGLAQDSRKQQAAEAFVNFLSRPDIAIRNMYYIGYTSCIAGGDDNRIFDYVKYNFEAEDDEEDTSEYSLGYFFSNDGDDPDYMLQVPSEQLDRQLYSSYPDEKTIERTSIMVYFDDNASSRVNQMWINVRCFNFFKIPVWAWLIAAVIICGSLGYVIRKKLQEREY